MTLAIIPARGGSKRIPRKNLRLFAGKPMIAYAIDAAARSKLFSRIVVSTDDHDIAEVAQAAGADIPFIRPDTLSDDLTPTVPVVAHAISATGDVSEDVCCIYPGVPLLDPACLASALEQHRRRLADYTFPVVAFPSPIQRALKRGQLGETAPFFPQFSLTRTQDLEPAYQDAGQFYWGRREAWLAGRTIHDNATTIVVSEDCAVDIDEEDDWAKAELLFELTRRSGRK